MSGSCASVPSTPHDDPTGVRQRLNNLGYFAGDGPIDDEDGDAAALLELAVRSFQEDYGLVPSGELDAETTDKCSRLTGASRVRSSQEWNVPRRSPLTVAGTCWVWPWRWCWGSAVAGLVSVEAARA